ncbi:TRAF3 [Branchiostoma lanceolatum]|uniref:ribonuclease H n=1 Tax=Branchiostoma lanceolatum TaxID=7740 RepID=A0A8S4MPT1_BRALA|nr:TRAF3 [Branchiostoma lanceolatum]
MEQLHDERKEATERELNRQKIIKQAFGDLRTLTHPMENEDTVSRINILTAAIQRITDLQRTLTTAHRASDDKNVNRITLEQQLTEYFNNDFSETREDKKEMSVEDKKFMNIVSKGTNKNNGHYQVPLPFKNGRPKLPNNKQIALQRAQHVRRKMMRNESFQQEYTRFMEKIIDKGYAEKVPTEQLQAEDGQVWYVPHHGVYHPQKGKIRVVFDCAASYAGTSLNKELLQGPDLTNTLLGVLTRFRQEPVVLMADIEAMFSQVKVPSEDRDYQRFMWWPEGDINEPLEEYRMTVHVFGATSSPSCANYALKRIAEDFKGQYNEEVLNALKEDFYVDDLLKAMPTDKQGQCFANEMREACATGGFRLTKWVSNCREVLKTVPTAEMSEEVKDLDLDLDKMPVERTLGMLWNVQTDMLGFRNVDKDKPATKRGILSTVSSMYDPLGLIAPATLHPKLILQDLCREKKTWDERIPEKHVKSWQKWEAELPLLSRRFEVDRCVKPVGFGDPTSVQLHHFADASESGYGTASYIRLENQDGRVHCALLMGKARVAPLKKVTIPRLELNAAVVAVRVDSMLKRELDLKTTRREDFIDNSRWVNGPQFLWGPKSEWPQLPEGLQEPPQRDPEVKVNAIQTKEPMQSKNPMDALIGHYSSWYRLKKAVAWIAKVKQALKQKIINEEEITGHLEVGESCCIWLCADFVPRVDRCPTCRREFRHVSVREHMETRRRVGQISAECKSCKDFKGTVEEVIQHKRNVCGRQAVYCCWNGCTKTIQRRFLRPHEDSCDHREVSCECGHKTTNLDLEKHRDTDCTTHRIKCPVGCGMTIRRLIYEDNSGQKNMNTVLQMPKNQAFQKESHARRQEVDKKWLRVKDKFQISDSAIHEIRMLAQERVPPLYIIQEERKELQMRMRPNFIHLDPSARKYMRPAKNDIGVVPQAYVIAKNSHVVKGSDGKASLIAVGSGNDSDVLFALAYATEFDYHVNPQESLVYCSGIAYRVLWFAHSYEPQVGQDKLAERRVHCCMLLRAGTALPRGNNIDPPFSETRPVSVPRVPLLSRLETPHGTEGKKR